MADLNQLEEQWLAARFATDYKTNKSAYETNARYRAEVDKMQHELEVARANAAAPPAPTVNQADIDLLNRAASLNGGKSYFQDHAFRGRIEKLRADVFAGGRIPENVRAATEADLAAREGTK